MLHGKTLAVVHLKMKCKTCGKNADSEYCFAHKARKPLSSGKGLSSKMSVISSIKAKNVHNAGHNQQRDMFLSIWKKRKHHSEVSGAYLGKEPMSTYFHHILPKEKYPDACLDEENANVFETPGEYTIYHFALENADYYMNYGVFANGLLVESSSKRYMIECSQMVLMP